MQREPVGQVATRREHSSLTLFKVRDCPTFLGDKPKTDVAFFRIYFLVRMSLETKPKRFPRLASNPAGVSENKIKTLRLPF